MTHNLEEILSKISSIIDKKNSIPKGYVELEDIMMADSEQDPLYDKKPFKEINAYNLDDIKHLKMDIESSLFGVDGSSKSVVDTNEFAILMCRIVGTNLKKRYISEYISFAYLENEKEYVLEHYFIRGMRLFDDGKIGNFDAYDTRYTFKGKRADPKEIASILRKFGEWKIVEKIMEEEENAIIIKDGGLHSTVKEESHLINEVIKKQRDNLFAGLIKNNLLITTTGRNLIYDAMIYVESKYEYKRWLFGEIAIGKYDIHPAKIFIAKFHESSRPYRIDIPKSLEKDNVIELINAISLYTNDSDFLGYPYILVMADRESNIKDHEIIKYKNALLYKSKKLREMDKLFEDIHKMLWKM